MLSCFANVKRYDRVVAYDLPEVHLNSLNAPNVALRCPTIGAEFDVKMTGTSKRAPVARKR